MENLRRLGDSMKIAIPTSGEGGLNSKVAEHFGRCDTYTFLDENGSVVEVVENASRHRGGNLLPPEMIKEYGGDILLCKGIGYKAVDMFRKVGIEVYICEANTVAEIFGLWRDKKVKKAGSDNVCEGHK
jgi:predicted Fe-Mo cluster-binding NifX family protein